uniref:Uncharacterized protein n=1 Tax=Romanomermis culicivorax TaxID=13658 RepID=A0A915L486_ROMCU
MDVEDLYAGGPIYFSEQINLTANVICQQNLSPEHESSALEIATNSAEVGRNTVAHQEVHCYLKDDMCREKAQSPAAETAENAKGGKMEAASFCDTEHLFGPEKPKHRNEGQRADAKK